MVNKRTISVIVGVVICLGLVVVVGNVSAVDTKTVKDDPTKVDMVTEKSMWNMWDTEYDALVVQQSSQRSFITDDSYTELVVYQSSQLSSYNQNITAHKNESVTRLQSGGIGVLEFHYEMIHNNIHKSQYEQATESLHERAESP